MTSLLRRRGLGRQLEELSSAVTEHFPSHRRQTVVLRSIGWGAAGAGALTLGLVIGRELRQRYKFNRRTPYDFYAHSGEQRGQDVEFGVGI